MYKRWIKNLIIGGIPTIIGAFSIFITIDALRHYISIFVTLTIILMITHICFVIYYAKSDFNIESENAKLKSLLQKMIKISNANSYISSSIPEFAESWATTINKLSNDIKEKGQIKENDWNTLKIFKEICLNCRNMIKEFTRIDDNSKVSVGFISYYENDGTKFVKMEVHTNPQTTRPGIFDVEESLAECVYQYAKIIKRNDTEIYVLENNEEILRNFEKKHSYTDLSKYTQYIAVPIFCSRNKILGILQIVTKNGYIILNTKTELREFGEKYIIPYTDLILLAHKIQKFLYSKPFEGSD